MQLVTRLIRHLKTHTQIRIFTDHLRKMADRALLYWHISIANIVSVKGQHQEAVQALVSLMGKSSKIRRNHTFRQICAYEYGKII
jgi:hypothetical protein